MFERGQRLVADKAGSRANCAAGIAGWEEAAHWPLGLVGGFENDSTNFEKLKPGLLTAFGPLL